MNINNLLESCNWDVSNFLIFSSNVFDSLIYYSHLLPLIISLVSGFVVLLADSKNLANRVFVSIMLFFSVWVFSDLVLWASEKPSYIMFFWTLTILFEPMIYAGCFYLLYVVIYKKDLPDLLKLGLFLILAPTIILAPTKYAIESFDLTNCNREVVQGIAVNYGLGTELLLILAILILTSIAYTKSSGNSTKKQIVTASIGILLFLVLFSLGNIMGTFTDDWKIGQYGILGMPILVIFFSYAAVKFNILNVKIIGAQLLVSGLSLLIGSLLFVVKSTPSLIISSITFVLSIFFGYFLIRSVKKEVEIREYALNLAEDLSKSNDKLFELNKKLKELDRQKTEFVSMASHQLRTPLTAIKGYSSMLLEGSFGELSEKSRGAVDVVYQSSQRLVSVIEDFLNITRIELGKMKYDVTVFDIRDLVKNVTDELIPFAKRKKLNLVVNLGRGAYQVSADYGKMSQVVSNVIDNAIKYTPAGSVSVEVTKPSGDSKHIHINVKDTGVGIAAESIPKLFQKFIRADEVGKTHITGTGLGLYVVKQILDAHKGTISIESPGVGKGTTFSIVLNSYQETSDQETQEDISEFADNL